MSPDVPTWPPQQPGQSGVPGLDPRFPYGKGNAALPPPQNVGTPPLRGPMASGSAGPAVVMAPRRKFPWWAWLIAIGAIVFGAVSFLPGLLGRDSQPDPYIPPIPTPSSTTSPTWGSTPTPSVAAPTTGPVTPVGNGEVIGSWEVEVISMNRDASDLLDDYGRQALEPGRIVVGVQVKITNLGRSAGAPSDDLALEMRFAKDYYPSYGSYYVDTEDQLFMIDQVQPGETVETWEYFEAPEDFTGEELWGIDYVDYTVDPVFIPIPAS